MGNPTPCPPIESGLDCPLCTPVRWPVGETPKYVYVMFWGIADCGVSRFDAPNGETFRLEQNVGSVCNWQLLGSVWHIFWDAKQIAPPLSRLRLLDVDGFSFFTSQSLGCPLEYWRYVNSQGACILMFAGAMGFGTVWWNDKNFEISTALGLGCGPGWFDETFRGPGLEIVTKFTNLDQRTNIRIQSSFP